MANLPNPIFNDDTAAREELERVRWPNGPICPHCGNCDQTKIARVAGVKKSHRPGLIYCNECKGQFTVTVGTVFERSKVPLSKWWLAVHLLASSKKGMSAHQIHRMLGVTYKTAWFMCHRIREAMKEGSFETTPMGGAGKTVEADETYIGKRETPRKPSPQRQGRPYLKTGGGAQKRIVVGLVERDGRARMMHLNDATAATIRDVLVRNVSRDTTLYTDESRLYTVTGKEYAAHRTVKHSVKEYARREGDVVVHTNTIEGVFSVFKRGMIGVYQHCGEAHLHRYLAEFDFRYNRRTKLGFNDAQRADDIMRGIEGKRLTYRSTHEAGHA